MAYIVGFCRIINSATVLSDNIKRQLIESIVVFSLVEMVIWKEIEELFSQGSNILTVHVRF